MDVILYEDAGWSKFGPIAQTRHVAELRVGRWSMLERAERLTLSVASLWGRDATTVWAHERLGRRGNAPATVPALMLNARGLWTKVPETDDRPWIGVVPQEDGTESVACLCTDDSAGLTPETLLAGALPDWPRRDVSDCVRLVDWPWGLFLSNAKWIIADWRDDEAELFGDIDEGAHLLAPDSIHLGKESRVRPGAVIDAEDGPVWIGERVNVGPCATIQGPCVIGDDCVVQAHAHVREGSTLGPWCKVGGEIEETIIQGYSNKQHHGFLGHSYLGSWINLGAGCTNSDLKNTYGRIRMPIGEAGADVETGSQFCGMVVGDWAKLGINTAVPTGAVVGVGANVVGPIAPKFCGPMTWTSPDGTVPFAVDKAAEIARRMMGRRGKELTEAGERVLRDAAFAGRSGVSRGRPIGVLDNFEARR